MSLQPDTDRGLAETSGKLSSNGVKLLAVGVVMYVVGAVLLIVDADFPGLALIGLATPPTIAGVALIGSGIVGRRASKQKDFA